MLFDLRGHRRRAVQATYVILAVLMGGGLVLFGIGGSSGGILDAITGNNSSGANVDDQLQKRIDRQQERLKTSPANAAVLAELVRLNYQAAVSQQPSGSSTFPEDSKDELRKAGAYWDRYVQAKGGEPSPDLARFAYTIFGTGGLNKPAKAEEAVRAIAAQSNDSQTYLLLVQTATAAGDTRTAQLAAQKAVDLAPKAQRKQVQKVAKQLQKAGASLQPGASTGQ
jgi:hypothetical protein